ncbi:MAG: type I-C CRISPR-associated protein Cas5c [Candidatus Brocadiia bacterium]
MSDYPPVAVKVWGDFACFTRPEMKVERVSYDVMTPSAARGVLEAIFWKPEFKWRVRQIEVLRPIRRVSLLRNEVKTKIAPRTARDPEKTYFADDDRTQRHTLALRDVAYVIRAGVDVLSDDHPAKYRDQFRRRISRGQCFHRPYLGCREFSAHFAEPAGDEQPVDLSTDLGRMLFDVRYEEDGERMEPIFFNARLQDGILEVPGELHPQ